MNSTPTPPDPPPPLTGDELKNFAPKNAGGADARTGLGGDAGGSLSAPDGDVTEVTLAEALGLSRADLKSLRKRLLAHGEDWYCHRGQPLRITESGRAKLAAHLEKKRGPIAEGRAERHGADQEPDDELERAVRDIEAQWVYETLRVTAVTRNPGILLAVTPAGDEVRCQVRSNVNFRAGMTVEKCRRDGPTLYTYQGRLPRRKGRWR
jgi:hypothetical protein